MKKRTAAENRTRPEIVTPESLFTSFAVSGHAEIPENSANQPFVSGIGPFSRRSRKPPPPATMAQAQAAITPSVAPSVPRLVVFCVVSGSADMDANSRAFKLGHYH